MLQNFDPFHGTQRYFLLMGQSLHLDSCKTDVKLPHGIEKSMKCEKNPGFGTHIFLIGIT